MKIAFTGSRTITDADVKNIYNDLDYFICSQPAEEWHVGDAPGLDALIREAAPKYNKPLIIHRVTSHQKWAFAERSMRMIDAISSSPDPWLYAFPNKACPDKCSPKNPFSGHGSGTWGTIAYAKKKGLKIYFFPLNKFNLPGWLHEPKYEQLSLF
jgi:hypothetical protein